MSEHDPRSPLVRLSFEGWAGIAAFGVLVGAAFIVALLRILSSG